MMPRGGLAGALASIRENVDKSSIGKTFGTPGWYKNQWQGVEEAVKMNSFKHTMAHYREAFRAFCALNSHPMNFRPSACAITPVVPLPRNGS